jgi:hypothetical protein
MVFGNRELAAPAVAPRNVCDLLATLQIHFVNKRETLCALNWSFVQQRI